MDLKSGCPYYLARDSLQPHFSTLHADHASDVVILGGGISGALMAYQLVKNGIACTVIDKRNVGQGSTCASTSLLQYEIDNPLHKLEKQIGQANAIKAYKLCSEGIDILKETANDIGFSDFEFCESLYFSHATQKDDHMKNEFNSRKNAGFDVVYLSGKEVFEKYGLHSTEAILSSKAAKTDAYLFTRYLHNYITKMGAAVFENTCVKQIQKTDKGARLITDKGYVIRAGKIIYATGYESLDHLDEKIVELNSTYACASEKIPGLPGFFKQTLFWNTADPYLYIREDDGRIIIGGRDEKYYDPVKRELLLGKKAKQLAGDFEALFPGLRFNIGFEWAGTFGSTKDGLPYIGTMKNEPNTYYALGYGGNGITFSAIATKLIAGCIKDGMNAIPEIFSFNR